MQACRKDTKSEREKDRLQHDYPYADKFADRFLALAQKYPKQAVALDSLSWVLQQWDCQPGNLPVREKRNATAVDLLIADHIQDDKIANLLDSLPFVPSPAWEKLLRSILGKNTQRTTQGLACFRLGQCLEALAERRQAWQADADTAERDEKYYGPAIMEYARSRSVEQLSKEAEALLERVVAKYGDIEPRAGFEKDHLGAWDNKSLGKMAEGELYEFRHLRPGREAPEIAGEGLDGKRLKLSDYRGKVVVVVSWTTWCVPCRYMFPHERALAQKFAGKPFALLGVNGDSDRDKAKKMAEKEQLSWPCFWDGGSDCPIVTKWRLRWPTTYVLDDKAIIRRKYIGAPPDGQLERDVDDLLTKMEATRPERKPDSHR